MRPGTWLGSSPRHPDRADGRNSRCVDAERREWVERVADACERVLADRERGGTDAAYLALLDDVAGLLARLRAELKE